MTCPSKKTSSGAPAVIAPESTWHRIGRGHVHTLRNRILSWRTFCWGIIFCLLNVIGRLRENIFGSDMSPAFLGLCFAAYIIRVFFSLESVTDSRAHTQQKHWHRHRHGWTQGRRDRDMQIQRQTDPDTHAFSSNVWRFISGIDVDHEDVWGKESHFPTRPEFMTHSTACWCLMKMLNFMMMMSLMMMMLIIIAVIVLVL